MSEIVHPNLVLCYGELIDEQEKIMHYFLEFCDGGSLHGAIQKAKLSDEVVSVVMKHCLLGLKFLHDKNILHRDIKTENTLLSMTEKLIKMTDFGLSKKHQETTNTFIGTIEYMSPERLNGEPYTTYADLFSLGLVALECHLGKHPFDNRDKYWDYVGDGKGETLFEMYHDEGSSEELISFVNTCTYRTPEDRTSCAELLEHPLIKKYEDRHDAILKEWFEQLSLE
eukprot:CAMPEP_0184723558 /NCGR_PEP_ID=MMETSP0314-20130426/25475_1 /TAXON_ID=38298 /ORGANISM="Rhodella maculata, Strain CCMP 736" /LENGTH=225 /DNA_ID=CAMNT_0027188379 /DNA_START=189 /DNA_END=866 /DNA_ORIENTATION=+